MTALKLDPIYQSKDAESAEIQELYKLFLLEKAPALVGPDRTSIPIPESIYSILLQVIGFMSQGKGVSVVPVMQELTTQQAANLLGVSRPFLVELLNQDSLDYHKVGTHRRVYLKDLLEYRNKRDGERKRTLDDIAKQSVEDGDYDEIYNAHKEE